MQDRFLVDGGTLGPLIWNKHVIGEMIKIGDLNLRIIACEPHSHHKTALVEDSFIQNGVQKTEFFHYDDTSITWVPQDAPRYNRECSGSVMVVEKIKP
jgi:hypothetical protein